MKSVFPTDATTADLRQAALLCEARVLAVLDHPNIVPVHAVGVDQSDGVVVVMKCIEGTTWTELLERRQCLDEDLDEHLRIFGEVCQAIAYAHKKGVLHRDLKPANVMIGAFGEVYVLDWGLAIALDERGPASLRGMESVTRVVGTPSYMAPEMVLGPMAGGRLGEPTDVYLLGGLLHIILTGRPPHSGSSKTETLRAAFHSVRPKFDADVPAELASVCAKALDREPDLRFPTAHALLDAVRAATRHMESEALAARTAQRLDAIRVTAQPASDDDVRAFGECGAIRFGFEQALAGWPANGRARAGLREVLIMTAEAQLTRGNPIGARDAIADLVDPPSDLVQRIDAAAAAQAAIDHEVNSLRELQHLVAPVHGRTARRIFGLIIALAVGSIGPVILFVEPHVMPTAFIAHFAVFFVVFVLATVVGREQLIAPGLNRRQIQVLLLCCVVVFTLRLLVLGGVPIETLLAIELMVCGYTAANLGLTNNPYLRSAIPGYTISSILAFALPQYAMITYSLGHMAGMLPVILKASAQPIGELELELQRRSGS